MAVSTGSRHADTSALEALVDAAAGILAADSLSDTLGRIAHHLGVLLDFDEITLYEVDRAAGMLRPVFALGAYADEVMADAFPIGEGVTGWVVANRRTRNVERADHDPIVAVVEGTELEPESLVSVPLIVGDRVVAALNVYRIGVGTRVHRRRGRAGRAFATMAALAFDSARQRETLREQARSDGLTGLLNHRACHERLGEEVARATAADRPLSVVVLDLDHFKTVNDALRPRRGRQGARRGGRPAALDRARGRRRRTARRRGVRADPPRRRRRPRRRGRRARARRDRHRRGRRPPAVVLGRRRLVPRRRARGRPPARAGRRRDVLGQALGPRPEPPLRPPARRRAVGRRAARRGRGAAREREDVDRPGLPARARARHRPRRRLRGARADARRTVPAARPVVRTRPTAPVSAPRWRRPRCAPPSAPAGGRSAPSSRSTSARARCSRPRCAPRSPTT